MEGVDYSWDRPSLNIMWDRGIRFVSRYLAYLPNGKVLTRGELAALHQKGFGVCLNWEQAAGDMLRGYNVGQSHAHEAARQAGLLGVPAWVPIYFSCDTDITSQSQMNAVAAYLDGCANVLGRSRVGVYGEYSVIEYMLGHGHAVWGWQTYAWSGGRVSGKAHFYQYRNGVMMGGGQVDLNRTLKEPFGAWFISQPQPPAPQPVEKEEVSMFFVQKQGDATVWRTDGFGEAIPLSARQFALFSGINIPYMMVANDDEFQQATGKAYEQPQEVTLNLSDEALAKIKEAIDDAGGVVSATEIRRIVDEESISADEIQEG